LLGKGLPNAGIYYSDVVLRGLRREENDVLHLLGIYSSWYYMDVWYEGVLYSQIDETSVGLRIALVEELTFDEFGELRHNMGRNRMVREAPERFSEFINALTRKECRLFAHYTTIERPRGKLDMEERFVLARGIRVEGPAERYAREEAENREYIYQCRLRERRRFLVRALAVACVVWVILSGLTGWAVFREMEAAKRREEAGALKRFIVEEILSDARLPKGARTLIEEKIRGRVSKLPPL
jgi:hypothetical protein